MSNVVILDSNGSIQTSVSEPSMSFIQTEVVKDDNVRTKLDELHHNDQCHPHPPSENGHLALKPEIDLDDDVKVLNKFEGISNGDDTKDWEKNSMELDQQALQDVGNKVDVSTPLITPKKSLLKRPKSETPNSSVNSNPPKRIRIVENLEAASSSNVVPLIDEQATRSEIFEGADDLATVTEVSSCGETLRWLNSPSSSIDQSSINIGFVRDNLSPMRKTFSVEIDMRFILTETCTAILGCKSRIAEVGPSKFDLWNSRHSMHNNPKLQQVVYKVNFLKLANIDAVLDYDLSSPKEFSDGAIVRPVEDNVYYVGDLWQNSKGFREYLVWKTSQSEKQFSTKILTMRIIGPNSGEAYVNQKAGVLFPDGPRSSTDERDLVLQSTENIEAIDSSLDFHNILDFQKMDDYVKFVHSRTNGKGLHTLIVDNAEVSHVYESCREIRFQKYFYCECLLALRCLREGGSFVCKIFDTFTLFTNGLLFLMYKCFKSIAIHKPSSSPACSSERFLLCKEKIENVDSKYVIDFLSDCLDMVVNNQEQRKIVRRKVRRRLQVLIMEVQRIIPLRLILSHVEFFQFVRESNIRLTTELAESINALCYQIEANDQIRLKNQDHQSLPKAWSIATELISDKLCDPLEQVQKFLFEYGITTELCIVNKLIWESEEKPSSRQDFLVFPVQMSSIGNIFRSSHGWFVGCGGTPILHLINNVWTPLEYSEFSLPYGTIVFGEISEEIHIKEGIEKFVRCFHIFDGAFIRGVYIGSLSFDIRQSIISRFTMSLKTVSTNVNCVIVRAQSIDQMDKFYLSTKANDLLLMGYNRSVRCHVEKDDESDARKLVLVDGFLITKNIQDLCPANFFKKTEQLIMMWNNEHIKSTIEEFQSRFSVDNSVMSC